MDQITLGTFLRTRREALRPDDVGLSRGSRRRAPGLRREEVAQLADMSADYLARLERGDGSQPSPQIIGSLARALRLTHDERDHLLTLAGHRTPIHTESTDHVSPGLLRILDRLIDTPAQVMGPVGETLAQNAGAVALFGDETRHAGRARSAPYRWFTHPTTRSLYPAEDHNQHSRVQVSQLRTAVALLGPQSAAAALAQHLRAHSPEFEELWTAHEVGLRHSQEKHFLHPAVGPLTLYCQVTQDPDTLQTLLVFTPTPGSDSAEKLRLLTVLGTYDLT